jgi:hypothetical protein
LNAIINENKALKSSTGGGKKSAASKKGWSAFSVWKRTWKLDGEKIQPITTTMMTLTVHVMIFIT